jgi:hypothetical protein
MKIVVTMTSYPKRIKEVGKFIYRFFKTQTERPDYFYLWLSSVNFPNKEKDLPQDLLYVCDAFGVIISWVDYDDGCTKRWNVYPKHYEDCVVAVDEDNEYDYHLIETMRKFNYSPKTIYAVWESLTNYLVLNEGIDFRYIHYKKLKLADHSLRMKISGNSVIPPRTFPLEALNPEYLPLRLKYCKKCDESWLQPFYRCAGIESSVLHLKKYACDDKMNATGINAQGRRINGVWWKNLQMYLVLRLFPKMMERWKELFPSYNDDKFKDMSIDELAKLLG